MDRLSKHFMNISNRLEIDSFVPGVEVQIRGKDENKLEQGREGKICIRGHDTMKAYLNNPQDTRAAFWNNGWLRSGDVGLFDGELETEGSLTVRYADRKTV